MGGGIGEESAKRSVHRTFRYTAPSCKSQERVLLRVLAALFSIKSFEEVNTRLGKDGMQVVVTEFVAEFDAFLSTAGSSGLVGKCVWPPQLPGHALGVPVSYTGTVNPWGVTTLSNPCLPQCRIHPVTGINYTEPDALPYCWRVKRVGANRFQVFARDADGHRKSTEYPRVSMALMSRS